VWISFLKTLAKVASSSEFSLAKLEKQLAHIIERVSERKKNLASLASGFVLLLAKPEFYSHLVSW
jgi:hypothetical protein